MREKIKTVWEKIFTKENIEIMKKVLLILVISRVFYIFIGCVANSAFGNNIKFAKMFLGGDADWYINTAKNGYALSDYVYAGDGQANWAFFPLFPISIRIFKYIFFFLSFEQAGIILSTIYVYIAGIFLVKTLRLTNPGHRGYMAVVLMYMGPYTFYLSCVYSETLFMMLLAIFFYYLRKSNYKIAAVTAMFASSTRIVGVILVFSLALKMYLDNFPGRISFRKIWDYIKWMLKNPVNLALIFICPLGIFVNMLHLYIRVGDAWAFSSVQRAWRNDGAGYIGNMVWDFFNNVYAERYWIPIVIIMAVVIYIYMIRKKYYTEVIFAVITLIIPLTSGVMSMCRFIVGSYVIFLGIYEYLADKTEYKILATVVGIVAEAFLIWLWFTAGVNAFTA